MAPSAGRDAPEVQHRTARPTFRTQHPSPLATPPVPRLIKVDGPSLLSSIDYEMITHDVSAQWFIPALKQSGKGQSRTLLDVRPDHAFLPPPATPTTHDDPVGFTEMIEF